MEVKVETTAVRDSSLRELGNTSKCVVNLKGPGTWLQLGRFASSAAYRISIYVGKFFYCWPQCNSNHLTNCFSSLRVFSGLDTAIPTASEISG